MSLFVGNVSRFVEQKDIEKEFKSFGECAVDFRNSKKGKFAFIQFKNDADAEQAKRNLQGKDLQGLKLNIEWSKKSGRFDENRGGTVVTVKEAVKKTDRSRSRSHRKTKRAHKSRSRSQSRSHQRNRSAPKYTNSKSPSAESTTDCPRDRILKEKIKQMKTSKKEKKERQKLEKDVKIQEEPALLSSLQVNEPKDEQSENGQEQAIVYSQSQLTVQDNKIIQE